MRPGAGPLLVVLSGLPGVGKSTLARAASERLHAVWLRIDSIEQALRESGVVRGALDDAGYRVGYALATDTLRLGHVVVADSVNPLELTRAAWRAAAEAARAPVLEVEVVCADQREHRRRVEERVSDVAGLVLPTWEQVRQRAVEPWSRGRLIIDTANTPVDAAVQQLVSECARTLRG